MLAHLKIPHLAGQQPPELCSKYFLYRISQIFVHIFTKNMKDWSGKSKILYIEQLGRAEKKTTKQKISQSSPSLCKYFPNIFLSPGYSKIFAAVFSKSRFNWSPHFITSFIKPVRIPSDSCENYSTAEMGFQLLPRFQSKQLPYLRSSNVRVRQ